MHAPRMKTIFAKLLTGYIALTLLIVMLTALVSFFLVRQYTINSNLMELQSKAEAVADMISEPGGMTRVLTTRRLMEMQALSDAQLAYISPDMEVRQVPPRIPQDTTEEREDFLMISVKDTLDGQLLQSLLDGQPMTDVRKLDFLNVEVVFAGAPIVGEDDQVQGAILLYRPLRQVSAATQRIVLMLALAGVVALAAATVLAYFMGKRLSQPLVSINGTAKLIADGHYHERVRIDADDEVGQLADTLNLLSERLSGVIENLNEEKSKLEKVLTSIGEGIIAIDRNGDVVHHNPAALEFLNLPDWRMMGTDDQPDHQRQLIEMLISSMNTRERLRSGFNASAGRTIEAISSPILSADGGVYGAVCLLRDISEAQRLEQVRRDYIANISHELRTPLTGIRGMVEPLLDGYIDTEEEKQDCYLIIYQETRRLERLIGEMLDLSRLQDGRIQMELEPMEAVPLLQAAARRLSERAKQGDVQLSVEGDENLGVMGNEDRIIQVLITLLDNALSFTPPGGSVTLSAERDASGMVALSVTDTGAGIQPDDLPYIWERFFKADRSRLRTQGVGLGLAIAKLIVELMGGQISVETELNKGSKFTFTLNGT